MLHEATSTTAPSFERPPFGVTLNAARSPRDCVEIPDGVGREHNVCSIPTSHFDEAARTGPLTQKAIDLGYRLNWRSPG